MNRLKQGEWFIISPILDGDKAMYNDGEISSPAEINKPIKKDLKTLAKCWNGQNKILDGQIVDGAGFVIMDAISENSPHRDSYSGRLATEINIESLRIQALNLKHIRILPIHHIGDDPSVIPKKLEEIKALGFSGIQVIRDLPFGELNPIIYT